MIACGRVWDRPYKTLFLPFVGGGVPNAPRHTCRGGPRGRPFQPPNTARWGHRAYQRYASA